MQSAPVHIERVYVPLVGVPGQRNSQGQRLGAEVQWSQHRTKMYGRLDKARSPCQAFVRAAAITCNDLSIVTPVVRRSLIVAAA
jgi:hypothetical protein